MGSLMQGMSGLPSLFGGGSSPGQMGGGPTSGMFSAMAQNPGTANLDTAQSTIAGQMPGAPSFKGQSPLGTPAGASGAQQFMQMLPQLLQSRQQTGGGIGTPSGGGGGGRGMQDIQMGASALSSLAQLLPLLAAA